MQVELASSEKSQYYSRADIQGLELSRWRDLAGMKFDTKIGVVLREDLQTWQKLNVTAFTISGIAGTVDGVIGQNYKDASGNIYSPMIVQPILIFSCQYRTNPVDISTGYG